MHGNHFSKERFWMKMRRRKVLYHVTEFVCCQEALSQQQQLKDLELRKLTEHVQKFQEERERLSEEVKQLRDHNYSLMSNINTLSQEKSAALLASRDLQIEVERLKHTLLKAESETRLLRRRTLRPLQEVTRERGRGGGE